MTITESPSALPLPHGAPDFPGRNLGLGDSGADVRMAQQRLSARGWTIQADGLFGLRTEEVVKRFQTEKGLAADGIIGLETWHALWSSPLTGTEPAPVATLAAVSGPQHVDPVGQIAAWGFEDVAAFQLAFAHYDITVDGGVGAETARAVQVVIDCGGRMSEFFHMNELRSRGNGRIRSHRQLLRRADEVRRQKGPWTPVSAYRDPDHNAAVGGAPLSQHTCGTAFDIPESLGLTVAEAAAIGFSGIGRCGNIAIHADVRAEGPNNTTGAAVGSPTFWDYC